MLVEFCVVDTHPPLVVVLLEDEDRVGQPVRVINLLDKPGRE